MKNDPNNGKTIGMTTNNGKTGFRIEWEDPSKLKKDGKTYGVGAHINVFNGKEEAPHFLFKGDQNTVNQIIKQFKDCVR